MLVKEKDVLDIAWKYFQQHAQQRISFFNFFVIFSGLMTTALITTFQEKFELHLVGLIIGLMLSLIAFTFWKIDDRNKLLTKLGENAIKEIESKYNFDTPFECVDNLKIFTTEERLTNELKSKKHNYIVKQISHSQSFNLIFLVFFVIGLLGAGFSFYYQVKLNKQNVSMGIEETQMIELIKQTDDLNRKIYNIERLLHEKH